MRREYCRFNAANSWRAGYKSVTNHSRARFQRVEKDLSNSRLGKLIQSECRTGVETCGASALGFLHSFHSADFQQMSSSGNKIAEIKDAVSRFRVGSR